MKAILCHEYGPVSGLVYDDLPDPVPSKGEVVVRIEAAGVNYPDGLLVQGLYQARPETPFAPGMESAGIVESVGNGVTRFKPGDRVAVMSANGGYAEKIRAPESAVFPLPDTMSFEDGCGLLCAWSTAHHALKQRAGLKKGETLVVLGAAGATGLGAIQIGRAMGARVIAVASTEDKRETCREAGADEAIGYDDLKDAIKRVTKGKGADVVFDPVGGEAFDAASRAMARHGRYLVIGFASGTIPKFPVNLALLKEFSLVGVFWGAFTQHEPDLFADNIRELFGWYEEGLVKPVIDDRFPLEKAAEVLERILNRGAIGKSILIP